MKEKKEHDNVISRDFISEDCIGLRKLHEKVWKIKVSEAYWKWKYVNSPFETKSLVIEDQKGELIAFAGFLSRPTKFDDKIIFPFTLYDIMADPSYRGFKIYGIILKRIREEIMTQRIFFGFPNEISHKVFCRYFRKEDPLEGNISVLISVVNAGSYLHSGKMFRSVAENLSRSIYKLRLNLSGNKKIFVQQSQKVGDEFNLLWDDISKEYYWIQDRSKDYLNWRYGSDPIRKYQIWKATERESIVGYMVTTINKEANRTRGLIVDWLVSRRREDVFRALLNTALSWLANHNVGLVEAWLMPHEKRWNNVLRSYFFVHSKRSRSFIFGGGQYWFDPSMRYYHEMRKLENLFFTIGDSDYLGINV